jgi:hypothetical protein
MLPESTHYGKNPRRWNHNHMPRRGAGRSTAARSPARLPVGRAAMALTHRHAALVDHRRIVARRVRSAAQSSPRHAARSERPPFDCDEARPQNQRSIKSARGGSRQAVVDGQIDHRDEERPRYSSLPTGSRCRGHTKCCKCSEKATIIAEVSHSRRAPERVELTSNQKTRSL